MDVRVRVLHHNKNTFDPLLMSKSEKTHLVLAKNKSLMTRFCQYAAAIDFSDVCLISSAGVCLLWKSPKNNVKDPESQTQVFVFVFVVSLLSLFKSVKMH